jgi:hypothetical protein
VIRNLTNLLNTLRIGEKYAYCILVTDINISGSVGKALTANLDILADV